MPASTLLSPPWFPPRQFAVTRPRSPQRGGQQAQRGINGSTVAPPYDLDPARTTEYREYTGTGLRHPSRYIPADEVTLLTEHRLNAV